jgi:hypothetical protein
MPRLLARGPGLAVSPDTSHIACGRPGRLALISAETRAETAQIELPPGDEVDVAFTSSGRLLSVTRQEAVTVVLAHRLPTLETFARLELPGVLKPLCVVGERMFIVNSANEVPRVVHLTERTLGADPIAMREPVQLAVAAPEDRLLVAARDQLEAWDPLRRRALFRIHLPLSSPRFAGFSSRRRLLWVTSSTRLGEFSVFRYSDGRLQSKADLSRYILGVDGHPESPRVILAVRTDESRPLELLQVDLSVDERHTVRYEGTIASFAMADGARPVLVVGDVEGPLRYLELPRSTPLEESLRDAGAQAKALANAARRRAATRAEPPPETAASWRERLGQPGAAPRGAQPAQAAATDEATLAEAAPDAPTDEMAEDEPAAAAPGSDLPAPSEWRTSLLAWGEAALSGSSRAPAPPDVQNAAPLVRVMDRFALDGTSAEALALLYAGWLLGEGDGLPAAKLARALGHDPAGGWAEALGVGALARVGLVRSRRGRRALRPVVGRFLDGEEPLLMRFVPARATSRKAPHGPHRVELGDGDEALLGQAAADRLGREVALVAVAPRPLRRMLPAGLVGAQLHGLVPLLVLTGSDDGSWLSRLGEDLVLVAARDELPGAPQLPNLALG